LVAVNPGSGTASLGFYSATRSRKNFPRLRLLADKFFAPFGFFAALRSQAMRQTRPLPIGSRQGRDGRDLK